MKIDRRSFLSFIIGGAAGSALTPLPWKLTDDLSIWTQNWPWTPVPPDGEGSYADTVCSLCPGGCGVKVRKIDERAVKIEGAEGHPVNDGGICILGLSGLQLLYGPTRVKTPLKKVGKGAWKRISWEEAISEVAGKLKELRANGNPQSLACIAGSDQGTVPNLFKRFLTAFGSPNFISTPSFQDSYAATLKLTQGADACAAFDMENADFILSFGSGIIEGWGGSPVRMFKANSALADKKAQVAQIEPRLSNTAAKASQWLPVTPGTEGDLALGLANVIISQELYNKDFVANHTFGFEDWQDDAGKSCTGFKTFVADYTPEKVAETTGLTADAITELARKFAGASKPLAICGKGQGKVPGSLHEFIAVHALNALVGNLNQPGGVWAVSPSEYISWPAVETDDVAKKGLGTERIDGAGTERYPYAKSLLNRFAEVVNAEGDSPIQALFVTGANPCFTLADTQAVKAAFEKIPFVVSFSSYMDETAKAADLILPNHIYLERYEDVPPVPGLQKTVIGLSKPVVEPLLKTLHTGDAIIQLAKAMEGSIAGAFSWDDYEACLKETLGDKWDALEESGFVAEDITPAGWAEAFAGTPSKKFEFFAAGYTPVAIEGDAKSYPLTLVPYDSLRLANGFIANTPFMTKAAEDTLLKGNDTVIEINPQTAKSGRLSLKEGDYASLTTPKGKAKVRVHLSEGIMPGIVAIPRGLGHTAYDDYLAGKGVNVNELIGPVEDPASGLDAAWGIRVTLAHAAG